MKLGVKAFYPQADPNTFQMINSTTINSMTMIVRQPMRFIQRSYKPARVLSVFDRTAPPSVPLGAKEKSPNERG